MIDLSPQQLETVKELLARHVPECEVRAFGSRVKWTAKSYSDLDLVVIGTEKLNGNRLERLREAFIESDLPFRVDVMDWHTTSEQFQKIISNQNNLVQDVRNPDGYPAKWKCGTLGEIANIVMGQSPPGETCNEIGQGIPLLNGPTEFAGYHPQPVQFSTNPRKFADPGDILFCVRGSTTGRMNWADRRYAIGRGLAAIQPKGGSDCRHFVRAVVSAALPRLLASATGSTFPNLSREQLDGLVCLLPSIAEQKAIASILGALDDKIELNRRMNATLEAMARALFQSWFVDFDPVRAKLDGRHPEGMDRETATLFPGAFQDSEIGAIPFGWKVSKLKEVTSKIGSGATPRGGSEVYVDEGPALIRSQNVYDHEFHWAGLARLSGKSAAELKNVEVMKDDVLLNITGDSILRTCIVDPAVLPARVNQHVAIIRAVNSMPPRYLQLYLVQDSLKSRLIGMSAGATRHAITKGHLESTDVVNPSAQVLLAFEQLIKPFFERIDANRTQSRTLATMRDTLLPKLLSGDLSIENFHPSSQTH